MAKTKNTNKTDLMKAKVDALKKIETTLKTQLKSLKRLECCLERCKDVVLRRRLHQDT